VKETSSSGRSCLIRRAGTEDAVAIQELYRELVGDAQVRVLPDHVATLAEAPGSILLVAEAKGTVVATALLSICADVMYGHQPFGVVENVVVTRAWRERGVGRRLLAHVEALAIERDCTKLMLLSGSHRREAHAFFRSCGFMGDTKHAFVKYRSQFTERSL
jgi:N-acetylglutamate synthase-like GNAT family acetyltransferase